MPVRFTHVVVTLALAAVVGLSGQADTAGVLFEAARKKEVVEGDLRGAIRQYQEIASRFKSDGSIAARALLRMAECHQKLGDEAARTVYKQILSEYSDQKEAAIARARLGATDVAAAVVKGDRIVWKGPDVDLFGTVSPDGRYLTYVDWQRTANLMLHDFATGADRPLTPNVSYGQFGVAGWSTISRTGDRAAYSWSDKDGLIELRLVSLQERGTPASRRLLGGPELEAVHPFDWSPDGKSIAISIHRKAGTRQIALISVHDGSVRGLRDVTWRVPGRTVFSPDGRHLAYDLPVPYTRGQSHVFVMPTAGGDELPIVADSSANNVMGWSSTGHLLFASDRTGAVALWGIQMEDGRPTSGPRLLKTGIGSPISLGLTPAGTLYLWKYSSARSVRTGSIDWESGTLSGVAGTERFIESRGRPDWSADGKHLLFVSCGAGGGGPCTIAVRSMDTGVVREVPHTLGYVAFPRLAPDGRAIVTQGMDFERKVGRALYLIDAASGATSVLVPPSNTRLPRHPDWPPGGDRIRYQETRGEDVAIIERSLASGQEEEIFRIPARGLAGPLKVSPDDRLVGAVIDDASGSRLIITPLAGGATASLLHVAAPEQTRQWQWTARSDAVIVRRIAPDARAGLWLIPLQGQPRRLNIDTSTWFEGGHLELHPDGRQVAIVTAAGDPDAEVWALENFLPGPAARGNGRR